MAKPFVEINISTGEVSLSPGLFWSKTVRKGKDANAGAQGAQGNQGAANANGGPSPTAFVDAVANRALTEALKIAGGVTPGLDANNGAPQRPARPSSQAPQTKPVRASGSY